MINLNTIRSMIHSIDNYYDENINTDKECLSFLKREVLCLNELLDLLDLSTLPLPEGSITELRDIALEAFNMDNYLELMRQEYLKILPSMTKKYSEMTNYEKNAYHAFLYLFPREVESLDLIIEYYIGDLLRCSITPEELVPIINKHFKDVFDKHPY